MKVIVCFFIFLFSSLSSLQMGENSQDLFVHVVEGTLHIEYTLFKEETVCTEGEALDVKAHVSWYTEKEKTTTFSVVMKGTPYTQEALSEIAGSVIALDPSNGSAVFQSEDVSGFWDFWFDEVSQHGFFSDYSKRVMYNWNEAEITLHEDHTGRTYSLVATYYDYFTKFYPTPEDFFAEREIDFQFVFGIHHIAPTVPLSIVITLPEKVEILKVNPPSFSTDETDLTLTVNPDERIPNVQVRFKVEKYIGTELPRLQVSKEVSSHHVTADEEISITVTVQNASSVKAAHVRIQDSFPEEFEVTQGDSSLYVQTLEGNKTVVLTYRIKPLTPGDFILEGTRVEFEDQFGKIYTVYSDDISVTVVKESGALFFVIVTIAVVILGLRIKGGR